MTARVAALSVVLAAILAGCSAVPNLDPGGMGCNNLKPQGPIRGGDPLAPGEPLAGTGVERMPAQEADALIRSRGLQVTYRYEYETSPTGGYSECWCTPPGGVVHDLGYGSAGEVIVFVQGEPIPGGRSQPLAGWGC